MFEVELGVVEGLPEVSSACRLRSLGGGRLPGFVHANNVGTSSFPLFLPPSKCSLQTREYSVSGTFCLRIFTNHCLSKFGLFRGRR